MPGGENSLLRCLAGAFLFFCALAAAPGAGLAQSSMRDTPALISADEITYDESLGVVTASGNVELSQDGRVLLADTVSYNQRSEVVTASGNVILMEPSGETLFADFVELTDDLREGYIRDIRILMSDRSRLAAVSALRSGGRKTVFHKGVFSPCDLCREDPTRAPLWQLKAMEIEHDQEEKVIRYRDAWMEIFGVPVMYVPYFEHPDPTVERKSGFLAPSISSTEFLGTTYQQPYYWVLGSNRDVTIAPIITSKQGAVMTGRYRHLLPRARIDLRGSATFADRENDDGTIDSNSFRGHIDSTLRLDINDTWRAGADIQRATDDTYLRIYNFSNERTLTSRVFAEGFNGRNYLSINSYAFQGLRATDIQDETPIILPFAEYNFTSEPGAGGGRYKFDGDLLALTREDGRDSRRISTVSSWELPYTNVLGDIYTLTGRVQADAYWTNGVDLDSNDVNPSGPTSSDITGRVFPQLAANWRYPWVRSAGGVHQVFEPRIQVVVAPNGSNPNEIPNEDSLDFEFDDTNLFSLNRFPGRDRIDPGSRVDYGLEWTANGEGGGFVSAFLGQSYRLREQSIFPEGSGISDRLSDIVGRIQIAPTSQLDFTFRTRLDKDNFKSRRSEVEVQVGPPILNLNLSYVFIDSEIGESEFDDREEINWILRSKISRYWSLFGGQRIDLAANETRQAQLGATYQDECFLIEMTAERNFFSDREIEPENAFFVRFVFKHLGGVGNIGQ